jgi:1-acyl-sn-glycerol-3-phosphate acyltransferase
MELFSGPLGAVLSGAGQIPLERFVTDPLAIRTSVKVLRDGGAVGVFPEGTRGGGELTDLKHGAAYLAMVTGATVQPVIYLGTRLPGGSNNSLPPRGSRMTVTYGEPLRFEAQPWPRRQPDVGKANERIGVALRDTLAEAQRLSGIDLPGPIPIKDPMHD